MSKRPGLMVSVLCIALLSLVGVSQAQTQDDSVCPSLVEQALSDIGDNCDAVDRNNVCYGFNRVDTAFYEEQPEDFFTVPADRAVLSTLQTIQTTALNSADSEWGVAVMNVQANVPGGLPGQAAVFLLYGDVEVENTVAPEDAFIPGETVNVTALVTANGRSGPGTNFNVVVGIPINAQLSADGLSPDATWVRVLYEDTAAWVSRDLVRPDVLGSLGNLPTISNSSRSPMQAIHLRTGFGALECMDAPSVLVVQGPDNVRVNINVNGADIQIGSTIALRTTEGNFLQVITLSGVAVVGGIIIPPGFVMQVPLTPDGQEVAGPWEGFRALTGPELEALRWIERTPGTLLHYNILLPSLGEILQTQAAIRARSTSSSNNNNPGQSNGDAVGDTPGTPEQCAGFVPTSPLGGAQTGPHTFYWDPAPGANGYRWILLDVNSNAISIFDTQQTNFTHTLQPTYSATLFWEVHALSGGEVICVSERIPFELHGGGQFGESEDDEPDRMILSGISDPRTCRAQGGVWDDDEDVCYAN